ncbi:hypothetical protein JHW43_001815 [Diplocarpon mali]|nr:hypothetical protein JHW43_001815 [Diplocarpon mali]
MFRAIITLAALSRVLACPDHAPLSGLARRDDEVVAGAWTFDNQEDWAAHSVICGNGTMQSPIDLKGGDFSAVYAPKFDYSIPAHGTLKNWGYGPSFDFNDTSSTPTFTVNNTVYYLLGFHTHTQSEHTVDGEHTPAEVHLVHGEIDGTPRGVVGFRIVVGKESPFFKQFLVSRTVNIPAINSTERIAMESIDMSLALQEGGNLESYWTYRGSLTTPPCTEGKRWWVSGKNIQMSQEQLDELLSVSADSSRETQEINEHDVGQL